jgi:hypothetical protein
MRCEQTLHKHPEREGRIAASRRRLLGPEIKGDRVGNDGMRVQRWCLFPVRILRW